jgi:hypothetical protein
VYSNQSSLATEKYIKICNAFIHHHHHHHNKLNFRLCKKHFLDVLKRKVRMEFKKVYRAPEAAFAALDFTGKGKI